MTISRHLRALLLVTSIAALPLPAGAQAPQWYDGTIQYSTITNCVSVMQGYPYAEYGAGTYVGFYADPNAGQPAPNQTYYIRVVVAGLGNACTGMRFYVDVALPTSTSLAIDGSNPVRCYADGAPTSPSECPQTLPASSLNPGAFAVPSTDAAHANQWPLQQGHNWEFQIPVRSTTALSSSTLTANVWVLDGNSSPWLHPQKGVYVFSNTPAIVYPTPSTILIAATTARSQAYVYTFGATGTAYFDLGTTTGYGLVHQPFVISTPQTAVLLSDDWGPPALTPDTLYHWRVTFTPSVGSPVIGADQTFRTLPNGRVTVGTGTPASCTEAAFNAALVAATEVVFDCGLTPVTITLSSSHSITSNLTINGANRVTLQRQNDGAGNHFNVQGGARLALTQITLSNAVNTSTCGGSVTVASGGMLTLNEARFVNNRSSLQGGAVCNAGTITGDKAVFSDNVSSSHGGAIGNYGSLALTNSLFVNNRSSSNGGAIDSVGTATLSTSAFTDNVAGLRGGGINTYIGTLSVTASSFTRNTAGMYGGGLANDASTGTVTGSTFSANSSTGVGGGIEMGGSGKLTLANITVSGNSATIDGGGLYWYPGSTGGVSFLNSTVVGNTAGKSGGNIYVGGTDVFNGLITVKNTIVSGGSTANCSGTVSSLGYNLEDSNTCGFGAAGDQPKTDPNLGLLQDNTGATKTHVPVAGSPAIDAATNSGCPATDQRGQPRPVDGDGDGSATCDIGAVETLHYSLPAPSSLTATATSGSQVALSWSAVVGATSYEVYRSSFNSSFSLISTTAGTSINDTGLTADTTYVYRVRALGAGSSWFSPVDAATTTVFTDTSLTGVPIKAVHITQLRTAVNAMRAAAGLPAAVFTDPTLTAQGTVVKRVHVTELRAALDAARVTMGLSALTYTDAIITVGDTAVKAVHITQLRAGTQ